MSGPRWNLPRWHWPKFELRWVDFNGLLLWGGVVAIGGRLAAISPQAPGVYALLFAGFAGMLASLFGFFYVSALFAAIAVSIVLLIPGLLPWLFSPGL